SANDDFKEELKIFNLGDKEDIKENDHKLLSALLCGIREFDAQMFNSSLKWIIGLSGGLDSTVDACLLTMALGKERVVGYNMASRYNSDKTKNNARHLANALGMEIREGSIEKITKATCTTLEEYGYTGVDSGLAYENIQARIRGHLLSSFAAKEGGVIINNGNKVEVCLGYCTLYGDSVGALAPIGDMTKVQLFELSHQINNVLGKEAVPYNLLPVLTDGKIEWDMAPSAELKDAQRDPMKWFYHDALVSYLTEEPSFRVEELMEAYLDGSIYETEMGQWIKYYGLDDPKAYIDDLHWFLNTMARNRFKRFQGAPIIRVSDGCFGYDFREAQISVDVSERFKELETKILNG
ncbi:MAG: NAD(+) synthase, partial [Erysipelotrichaceae bacterium]|nr:NAD(+) synthase [Erysipelotrichaceae bacterium]